MAVRQHMGVVLQHGRLVAGSLYENIPGMSLLSDDAWEAARAAALEEDIRAADGEMRTLVHLAAFCHAEAVQPGSVVAGVPLDFQ